MLVVVAIPLLAALRARITALGEEKRQQREEAAAAAKQAMADRARATKNLMAMQV